VFPFHVDQQTGVIFTRRQVDRETDGDYFRFDVTAGDLSNALYVVSDRTTVVVHVTDVNDNRPTIVFPACDDDVCELDVIMTSPGDVIVHVIAVDADDVNGQVRYELIGDATAGRLFAINATSGEVYVRREIGADLVEGEGLIQLQVRVTDAGTPPLTTTVAFVVRLNVTRHQRLGGSTSTNLALPLVLVAVAATVVVVICFLVARRVGPPAHMPHTNYITAPATYISQTSIDDLTWHADCSTDVAVGSSLRLQVALRTSSSSSSSSS